MKENKIGLNISFPVFMSFIVMGFIDLVGVITAYVKQDFDLSDNIAQLIPLMIFVWFFLLSVPTGILQDRFGKRNMVNAGMILTAAGMIIPLIKYSFPSMLVAVIFLGIGNTVMQVSANPLLHDVSPKNKYSSYMSLSQFVKAVCSLAGPIITTFIAAKFGDWKLVFAVYAITSGIAILWLYFTPIKESKRTDKPASFKSCFSLLKNKFIVIMVMGIFLSVGADVGMNTNIVNYLSSAFDIKMEQAALGISIYFTALMIGRFSGAILLNWIRPQGFLAVTALAALVSVVFMILAPNIWIARIAIFAVGLTSANIFPLIFAITIDKMPERVNEISGLMIMAISGGAVVPPLIGIINSSLGIIPGLCLILACIAYLTMTGIYVLGISRKISPSWVPRD